MKDFRRLKIWEKAHGLVLEIYEATRVFPKDELYGLTRQIRRSSSSIPTNIAEGCGRDTETEFKRFLILAMGSASEFEYQLILARDLKYLRENSYRELQGKVIELRRMMNSLIQKIKANSQ